MHFIDCQGQRKFHKTLDKRLSVLYICHVNQYRTVMNFESLVGRINLIQDALQAQAAHAVNLSLTARNWLVGYYIVEV